MKRLVDILEDYVLGRDLSYSEFSLLVEYYFKFEMGGSVIITDSILNFIIKRNQENAIRYIMVDRKKDNVLRELINNIVEYIPECLMTIRSIDTRLCKDLIIEEDNQLLKRLFEINKFTSVKYIHENFICDDNSYCSKFNIMYEKLGYLPPENTVILSFLNSFNGYYVSDFLVFYGIGDSLESKGDNSDFEDDFDLLILGMLNHEHYILSRDGMVYVMDQSKEYDIDEINYICDLELLFSNSNSIKKIIELSGSLDRLK